MQLLAIQRSTSSLPFPLISPGRTFLKRAPLLQVTNSIPKEREFLLFSDCLIWLASADKADDAQKWEQLFPDSPSSAGGGRPTLSRTRSKSDADLPTRAALQRRDAAGFKLGMKLGAKKRLSTTGGGGADERWVYKGHIDLVDLEVVLGAAGEAGEQLRLEVLSPRVSFALYAGSRDERDEWAAAVRKAKATLLVSLNVMNLNTTLTSSASTNHLRHALQAVPYSPVESQQQEHPKRGKVEHFVPAVWIPDSKTDSCMRCGRTFGWRRRRHHCRLCGRCVCHSCSTKVCS